MPRDTRDVADVTSDPATAATGKTAVLYRMACQTIYARQGRRRDGSWSATATRSMIACSARGPR